MQVIRLVPTHRQQSPTAFNKTSKMPNHFTINQLPSNKIYIEDKNLAEKPIKSIMGKAYPVVAANTSVEEVSKLINKDNQAVIVALENEKYHIITKHDIINSIK